MASEEHLKILKQGAQVWNKWRKEYPQIQVDLRHADLQGTDLSGMDFGGSRLNTPSFNTSNPIGADFWQAELNGANLSGSDFFNASFGDTKLNGAILRGSDLMAVRFTNTPLAGADFTDAILGYTTFARVDLSETKGLETVTHRWPSHVTLDTIYRSKGKIPDVFLRGTGAPDFFMAQIKSLVAAVEPIQFYSCFISYSTNDHEFANRLHADLQAKGVRCWFAPEDLKIGEKFRLGIDEAVLLYDKLLVVLSESSVNSTWVESEVEAALEKERAQGNKPVLFPIRLDDAVMKTNQAWAADIRRKRHIGDFSNWSNHNSYQKAFQRLLRDLRSEKKKG